MVGTILACMLVFLAAGPVTTLAAEGPAAAGIREYRQGNFEEAEAILRKARLSEPESAEVAYYLGLSLKQEGDYEGAAVALREALSLKPPAREAVVDLVDILTGLDERPEAGRWIAWAEREGVSPAEIAYLKGELLVREGKNDEAMAAFVAARREKPAIAQQADLQIAMLQVKEGRPEDALKSLQAVITSDPTSELAAFATDYEKKISTLDGLRRWRLFASVNYQYDDNVVLEPSTTVAGLQMPGRRDSGVTENLFVQYNAPLPSPWQFTAQYNLFHSSYTELSAFNQLTQTLSLIPARTWPTLTVSFPVTATHTLLDYDNYLAQVAVKPTATVLLAPGQYGQFSAGYSRKEFLQDPPNSAENRDAHLYNGLVGYLFFFADNQGFVGVRYEAIYEDAAGNNWANFGNRLAADVVIPLSPRYKAILSGEGLWQDYLNEHSVYGVKRSDAIYTGSVTLSARIYDGLFLNVQYFHTTADSNIPLYDYERNVVTTGVEYRY